MGPYTEKELLAKAKELSRRFRGFGQQEDLVSEGVVAYYEGIELGDTDENSLINRMRKAMHSYANYKTKPTTIPSRGEYYRLTKELPEEEIQKLSPRERDVYYALKGNTKDISDLGESLVAHQMKAEDILHWRQCLETVLTLRERQVFIAIAILGLTVYDLADIFDCSPQAISHSNSNAVKKLKEHF
jgi:RNA polymerase sigma factor (sigma-70 family)